MKTRDIRTGFLEFFKSKGHEVVESSSLVPKGDPTLLFTNAGMNQFKDAFLGSDSRSYTRAASCQRCLRISGKHNDLENVGVTARHNTLFEMLGNFSFGDYFKTEAIQFSWELVTEVWKLDVERLWVTVFENDDEAADLWRAHTNIKPERILKMTEKDNFWSMGDTGPCGPCSEIFYYLGTDLSLQSEEDFRRDDGRYIEFWNLVFMQFDRQADGSLKPLPKPSVDTGMGLERIAGILQGVTSNYDTDILRALIAKAEKLSGFAYDGSSYEERDLHKDKDYARDVAMRVIADHSRSIAFLVADGISPGSDGQAYVLRRLIRRAARHGRSLELTKPFLAKVCEEVVSQMGAAYPILREKRNSIFEIVKAEEERFGETLEAGLSLLEKEVELANKQKNPKLSGEVAFKLHDTYGFPLDLTQDALKAYKLDVDLESFSKCMEEQKQRSREDRKSKNIVFSMESLDLEPTEFLGYENLFVESNLIEVFPNGDEVSLVFKETPFYAESGGQVGDTGRVEFPDCNLEVLDTQKMDPGVFVHTCRVTDGDFSEKMKGQVAKLSVDGKRRSRIRLHHSVTHLLHSGLRKVLGEHVKQAGSKVDEFATRFDFSHFKALSDEEILAIECFVNSEVRANYEVNTRVLPVEEAKKLGAMALFGEKYGSLVRVVEIGPNSLEFCGGTHASRSGDIGSFYVNFESSISAGVRRIECFAGLAAEGIIEKNRMELRQIQGLLKGEAGDSAARVQKLISDNRELERKNQELKAKIAGDSSRSLLSKAVEGKNGYKIISAEIEGADMNTLKTMIDELRNQLDSGVILLGSKLGDQAILVAGVTKDLKDKLNMGTLVKAAAQLAGGKGGGRNDFAQAGGLDPSKLSDAMQTFQESL